MKVKLGGMWVMWGVLFISACSGGASTPTAGSDFTSLVGEILKDPASYEGKSVIVVGYFRGWDLLHECETSIPVTRSDWVVNDNSGAIYVSASGVGFPQGLNPSSKEDTTRVIRVSGRVALTDEGEPYLAADRVEVVK